MPSVALSELAVNPIVCLLGSVNLKPSRLTDADSRLAVGFNSCTLVIKVSKISLHFSRLAASMGGHPSGRSIGLPFWSFRVTKTPRMHSFALPLLRVIFPMKIRFTWRGAVWPWMGCAPATLDPLRLTGACAPGVLDARGVGIELPGIADSGNIVSPIKKLLA